MSMKHSCLWPPVMLRAIILAEIQDEHNLFQIHQSKITKILETVTVQLPRKREGV